MDDDDDNVDVDGSTLIDLTSFSDDSSDPDTINVVGVTDLEDSDFIFDADMMIA